MFQMIINNLYRESEEHVYECGQFNENCQQDKEAYVFSRLSNIFSMQGACYDKASQGRKHYL